MQDHHQPQKQPRKSSMPLPPPLKKNKKNVLLRYVMAGAQAAMKDVQGTTTVTVS